MQTELKYGILFQKNGLYSDELTTNGYLAKGQNIQNIYLKNNTWVEIINQTGAITHILLGEDQNIQCMTFIHDKYVWFHDNNTVRRGYLSKDQTIYGIYFKGREYIDLYDNKNIKSGYIKGNQKIQGKECLDGYFIEFYKNGRLSW